MLLKSFEELECWKEGRNLQLFTIQIVKKLPAGDFDIKDNLRRAARSVKRNIAEGFGRFHFQENMQFCRIARGSAHEVLNDFIGCYDEGHISKEELEEGRRLFEKCNALLNGYISYLSKSKENFNSAKQKTEQNKN